jgi:hypothetical protein
MNKKQKQHDDKVNLGDGNCAESGNGPSTFVEGLLLEAFLGC